MVVAVMTPRAATLRRATVIDVRHVLATLHLMRDRVTERPWTTFPVAPDLAVLKHTERRDLITASLLYVYTVRTIPRRDSLGSVSERYLSANLCLFQREGGTRRARYKRYTLLLAFPPLWPAAKFTSDIVIRAIEFDTLIRKTSCG